MPNSLYSSGNSNPDEGEMTTNRGRALGRLHRSWSDASLGLRPAHQQQWQKHPSIRSPSSSLISLPQRRSRPPRFATHSGLARIRRRRAKERSRKIFKRTFREERRHRGRPLDAIAPMRASPCLLSPFSNNGSFRPFGIDKDLRTGK